MSNAPTRAKRRQEELPNPGSTRLTGTQVLLGHTQWDSQRPGITGEGIEDWRYHRHIYGDATPARSFIRASPTFRTFSAAAIQAGITTKAGITDGSRQPEEPADEA